MDKMKVVVSKKATLQINDSINFLKNVSLDAAKDLFDEIKNSINKVSVFPYAYPLLNNPHIEGIEYRKCIVSNGRYAFIYSIKDKTIFIAIFIDFRRDNKLLLSDLS